MQPQRFTATLQADGLGRGFVAVPFDPDRVWRPKPRHPISGTINGTRVRGVIETRDDRRGFTVGVVFVVGGRLQDPRRGFAADLGQRVEGRDTDIVLRIECRGRDSCVFGIDCTDSCACETDCSGPNACDAEPDCPVGCSDGFDCFSDEPECDVCPA